MSVTRIVVEGIKDVLFSPFLFFLAASIMVMWALALVHG